MLLYTIYNQLDMDALDAHIDFTTQSISSPFKNEDWTIERRLRRDSDTRSSNETDCYLDVLPTNQGKDLIQIIDELKVNGKKPIRLLDIGGGAGLADMDLRTEYPSDVLEIVMIGHIEDVQTDLFKPNRKVSRNSTETELGEKNIKFISLDLSKSNPDLTDQLGGDFDVIIASHSLKWIAEKRASNRPDFFKEGVGEEVKKEMVHEVYELLKPNGVALIAPYDQDIMYGIEKLELNHDGVSFKKIG